MSRRLPATAAGALDELIGGAINHVGGVNYAAVTVIDRTHHVTTVAATHHNPRLLDSLQQQHQQGPCFDAAAGPHSYYISDLNDEQR
ncbi:MULTISPECIES: hypothetical protein [Williamsia]|uniref:hypothetical protein n=1 Tax=Williamsia TaxID=85043 RepID=UPI0004183A13|nr:MULTISPECIES: hypothetical protein [Williamsia]